MKYIETLRQDRKKNFFIFLLCWFASMCFATLIAISNFVCPKRISLYRREYCINNKFLDIKCDYIYIKKDFFSCFENLKKIYETNPIEGRKHKKIEKRTCRYMYFFSLIVFVHSL